MADLKGAVYELLASSDSPLSNAEIGRRLGMSGERVCQIEQLALTKLRTAALPRGG